MEVPVPEWGGSVYVRTLSGAERGPFLKLVLKDDADAAEVVALVAVDANGNRLFSDDDVAVLREKSFKALDRIISAAMKHNATTNESVEEGKDESEKSPS